MTRIHRLLATGAAVAVLGAGFGGADAAQGKTWRLSSMMSPDSIEGMAYTRFSELAGKYTGGRIDVKVYPNEQLGKWDAVIEQLAKNIIQVGPTNAVYLSKWAPGIKYISAPFVFKDYAHWARFMKTDLVKGWFEEIEKKSGLMVLGDITDFPRGSYRVLVSKEPLKSIDTIKTMKLRMFNDELAVGSWAYLGAEVRVLAWTDVYDAINRGIVNAVTSPAELVEPTKFYEVAPNVTRTDEYPQGLAFITNAAAFRALSAQDQAALRRAYDETAAHARGLMEESNKGFAARLKAKNVAFNDSFDTSPIVAKLQGFYKEQAAKGKLPDGFLDAVAATAKR